MKADPGMAEPRRFDANSGRGRRYSDLLEEAALILLSSWPGATPQACTERF
jgi:hypothetical protein